MEDNKTKDDVNLGIYSQYSKRIREISNKNVLVINVEKLMDYIDITENEMSYEELAKRFKRAAATVSLYQNGFRSVEKGSGFFLDYQNSDNPIYLQKLVDNQDLDVNQKELVLKGLKKLLKANVPDYMQMAFNADDDGNIKLFSEIDHATLMRMLIKDAEFED